jgi:hypothetical protein
MKKSFCEPGNLTFCLGADDGGSFELKRLPENGGDHVYQTVAKLEKDFAQGENVLHPGDVKVSTTAMMVGETC